MHATDALETFLRLTLRRRVERYVEFAKSDKQRSKFLGALYHDLESDLDSSKATKALSEASLRQPGYLFAPPDRFGLDVTSLRLVDGTHDDAILAISRDGRVGILRPEALADRVLRFEIP